MRSAATLLALAIVLSWPANPASADDGDDEDEQELVWRSGWTRVQPWEYGFATVSLAASFAIPALVARSTEPLWTGDFLLDFTVADALATEGVWRDVWVTAGDILFYAAMVHPAFDALVIAGLIHGSWDVAWQLLWIDLVAFAIATPLVWLGKHFITRVRPAERAICEDPTSTECMETTLRSFPGGHMGITATAAALACTHHTHLPLYGGGAAGDVACITALGASGVVFLSRMIASRHYLSDMLVGSAIGVLAGWLMPMALHYGLDGDEDEPRRSRPAPRPRVSLVPTALPSGAGVAAVGFL